MSEQSTNSMPILCKPCTKCLEVKPLTEFYKCKDFKDGLDYKCKICSKQYAAQWYSIPKNKEKALLSDEKWYLGHKEEKELRRKQHDLEHRDEINLREKQRRKSDVNHRIKCNLRCLVYNALKGYSKSAHTMELIGCTILELKLHLEKQFLPGMTWQNWGRGHGKWNIDHIIPIFFFNMLDPVEQYMCFRWQNLQPLWFEDNIKKGIEIIS